MIPRAHDEIETSRQNLLNAISDAPDVTFLRLWGNIGDELIYAGARQLLSATQYAERTVLDLNQIEGHTALISGGGGWCGTYHEVPQFLQLAEQRFQRVILLPSSFDTSIEIVRRVLSQTKALVFAREEVSYSQIRNLCNAHLAHDTAFFFNFQPYQRCGQGILAAFRTDQEAPTRRIPQNNNDISATCESLDEWLWMIARHAAVRTDRAHVTIAAALLGKRVEYRSSNYHKVPAIVDYALRDFPVYRMTAEDPSENEPHLPTEEQSPSRESSPDAGGHLHWIQSLRLTVQELAELIPDGATFLFVDDEKIGLPLFGRRRVPFLERKGQYWGPPPDDATAIRELERLREAGAAFMVFAWPAFWWLVYYAGMHQYLRSKFHCVLQNDRLVVFDLRS